MLQIENTIVSLEIIDTNFCCNLSKCMGACCIQGDSGAPLEDNEVEILEKIYPQVKPFLRDESIKAIEEQGVWTIDIDNDKVTPLVDNKECAYTIFENNIAKCGIEKAYSAGLTKFQKPISCHLYPIRLSEYAGFTAVNYHSWNICKPALTKGSSLNIPVYIFLKDALIRKFGTNWYGQLEIAAKMMEK
jgi:hypothetical protein